MTLKIDKSLLVNSLGYLNIYSNTIQNMLNILNDVNTSNEEKINAENKINNEITNIKKLVNTINTKCGNTNSMDILSDLELSQKGII